MSLVITSADIEEFAKEAIMASAIGKALESSIARLFDGYNNPIDAAVKVFVTETAVKLIREKFSPVIEKAVADRITAAVTEKFVATTIENTLTKLQYAMERDY